jgi:anti-anti-sigma regulatory factor
MQIKTEAVAGTPALSIIGLEGDLDASNFKDLIREAQKLYDQGARSLILDLSSLNFMSSSGLVAMHSIAKIFRGDAPPDLEAGWSAIHAASEDILSGMEHSVRLVNPQPKILSTLQKTGMDRFFAIYPDLRAAVKSFQDQG